MELHSFHKKLFRKTRTCSLSRKIMASRADPIIYPLILMFGSNYKKNVSKNEKFICKKLKYEYQEYHKKELSFFMHTWQNACISKTCPCFCGVTVFCYWYNFSNLGRREPLRWTSTSWKNFIPDCINILVFWQWVCLESLFEVTERWQIEAESRSGQVPQSS